jgi:hypothetical protein
VPGPYRRSSVAARQWITPSILIDGTSIQIRIARRIRGEVEVFTAFPQARIHMAAVCKTAPFALLPSVPPAGQFPVRAGPELRTGMDDLRA